MTPWRICMKDDSTLTTLARAASSRFAEVRIFEISYTPVSAISFSGTDCDARCDVRGATFKSP